ncbi:MAG: hypothetical protein ABI600_01470 [Luteolibacter sp.]
MEALLPLLAISLTMTSVSPAQTCREVVRDASGRLVQTIEHQNSGGGAVHSTTRDCIRSGMSDTTSTSMVLAFSFGLATFFAATFFDTDFFDLAVINFLR